MFTGLAVQPFVAAGLAYLVAPLIEWSQASARRGGSDPTEVAVSLAAGAGLVAFFAVMLAAVPILLWRTDRGPLSRAQVLWWGVAVGNLPGLLGLILVGGVLDVVRLVALGSLFGLVCSFVFWVISIRSTRLEKRPGIRDREAASGV
jgi:hypothetical protein